MESCHFITSRSPDVRQIRPLPAKRPGSRHLVTCLPVVRTRVWVFLLLLLLLLWASSEVVTLLSASYICTICRAHYFQTNFTTMFSFLFSVKMKSLIVFAFLSCLTLAHKSGDVKHKWWSIPEPVATVGKLFYFKIPHDSVVDNTGPIDVSII